MEEKNLNLTNKSFKLVANLWGCIKYHGVGKLKFYTVSIKAQNYIRILSCNLMLTVKQNYIFQQDDASSHTSNLAMNYFKINNIDMLDWPSNLPDLNPIEHFLGNNKAKNYVK